MTGVEKAFPQAGGVESDPLVPSESKDPPGGQSGSMRPNSGGEKKSRGKFAGKILTNFEQRDLDGLGRASCWLNMNRSALIRMAVRTMIMRLDRVFGDDGGG